MAKCQGGLLASALPNQIEWLTLKKRQCMNNEAINCSKFFASEAFSSKSHENSSIEFWNVKVIFQKGIKNLLGFLLKLKVLKCNDHTT